MKRGQITFTFIWFFAVLITGLYSLIQFQNSKLWKESSCFIDDASIVETCTEHLIKWNVTYFNEITKANSNGSINERTLGRSSAIDRTLEYATNTTKPCWLRETDYKLQWNATGEYTVIGILCLTFIATGLIIFGILLGFYITKSEYLSI